MLTHSVGNTYSNLAPLASPVLSDFKRARLVDGAYYTGPVNVSFLPWQAKQAYTTVLVSFIKDGPHGARGCAAMLTRWLSNMPWLPVTSAYYSSSSSHSPLDKAWTVCPCPSLSPSLNPLAWFNMSLSFCFLHVSVAMLLLLFGSHVQTTLAADGFSADVAATATTRDQPNPIASQYFNNATGVLNATLAIVPIPLAMARHIIPSQYGILEHAYRALLPDFPAGMYPVFVQAAHDHDIHFQNFSIPDFSRAGFEFPFLDLLQDGYSSFRWAPEQIISMNDMAIQGSEAYGTIVHPGTFMPPNDAYDRLPGGDTSFNSSSANQDGANKYLDIQFSVLPCPQSFPYPMSLFKNITNQPSFANASTCDQMIRLFNTSLTAAPFEPSLVVGKVNANLGPFQGPNQFDGVMGVQLATAFIENNYLSCELFKGYEVTDV